MDNIKQHWEGIYSNKQDNEVSWFQENPEVSLSLIEKYSYSQKNLSIIDIGGGNSLLSIKLADRGFKKLSVLDISKAALERSRKRNPQASITWIETNILSGLVIENIDIWHDRAVFHFLTIKNDIHKYVSIASKAIVKNGYLILGTFSESGPKKCSGLPITQYSEKKFRELFEPNFEFIECFEEKHTTPFNSEQNFIWGVFKRL
jgi:ribosomal protein L11 methylase PrmA